MALVAASYAGSGAQEYVLGTITTAVESDYADLVGEHERVVLAIENGATNSCVFEVQCSHDGTNWVTIVLSIDPTDGSEVTSHTVTAGAYDMLHFDPHAVGRYIRVDVTTANANGTSFSLSAA